MSKNDYYGGGYRSSYKRSRYTQGNSSDSPSASNSSKRHNGNGRGGRFRKRLRYAQKGGDKEYKFKDTTGSIALSSSRQYVDSFCLIPAGIEADERVGRKIVITKVSARITFVMRSETAADASLALKGELMRVCLYWDKQANGAPAGSTSPLLFQDTDIKSFLNLHAKNRFVVMMDKFLPCDMETVSVVGVSPLAYAAERHVMVDWHKKVWIPIEYNTSVGDITDMASNNIGLVAWQSNNNKLVDMNYKIRVRFIDA